MHNLLGIIFTGQKKSDQAIECYNKAIKLDPSFAMAYNNLGLEYSNYKKYIFKAENLYKKAITLDSKIAEPHNNLGSLYNSLNRFDEAIESYKKAIKLNSNLVITHHNLGNIYVTVGSFELAKKEFETVIKKNPFYTNSHRSLSRLIKYAGNEKHLNEMRDVFTKIDDVDYINKSNISFALGKAYEDIKDFKNSIFYYKKANLCYRKTLNFSLAEEKEKFKEVKEIFSKELFNKYNKTGNEKVDPIFILGMPRSGTTLLEQIISSHPNIFGADEVNFVPELLNENFGNNKLNLYFDKVVDFNSSDFKKMGESYIKKMQEICKNNIRTTDKLPKNFLNIGFIKLILPNSKIIHCTRNSKDNCLSIYKNHFPSGQISFAYDFDEIVSYYNSYIDLMHHWNGLFPNFIYNVKYENLISDTKNEIKKLLNFCDLSWNDECLNFFNNKKPIRTASDIQARSKIYNTSINSWKNYETYLKEYFDKLSC